MSSSRLLWDLENDAGVAIRCFLAPEVDGYVLSLERSGAIVLTECHGEPQSAIDRAGAMYRQFGEQGWRDVQNYQRKNRI
jgi:hypothetical protein